MLKGYAMLVGVGLIVLALLGLASDPPSPLNLSFPENLLHIGAGSLFVSHALVRTSLDHQRGFMIGMGALLVLAKVVIVLVRWPSLGFSITLFGAVCLVAGVGSLLLALFVGSETHPDS